MRGLDASQESLFVMKSLDQYVPADHPLRPIRAMVNEALEEVFPPDARPALLVSQDG